MNLSSLFSPKSIAIIGASTKPGSVGNSLTKNLIQNGYSGSIYPINPKTDTLFDLPCFKNILDIKDEIDLAIIIIPAASVPEALRQVGEKGVRAAIIISSGFKETGETGKALEEEIKRIAEEYHIALLGPNCLGFLKPSFQLNASFANRMPQKGNIAFFSQSGALCTALLDLTAGSLGFSYFVSTGNKATISENELLTFFAQDEETKVLGMYTEDIQDSQSIIETGRSILARTDAKPIVALKSGTTHAGTTASSSHTGALAGSDAAYTALFKQSRILRAESLEQLVYFLSVFSENNLPEGKRLGIITNAGGLGVLATDAAVLHGLEVSELSKSTQEKLQSLPEAASRHNPVDVLGDALSDRYTLALEAVASDDNIDMLLVIITPQAMTEATKTAEAIVSIKERSSKPIVVVLSGKESFAESFEIFHKHHVTTVLYPEAGAEALSALAKLSDWRKRQMQSAFRFDDIDHETAKNIFDAAKKDRRSQLSEPEVWKILGAYGFPFLKSELITNKDGAEKTALAFTTPVALKIVSPDITHKSDVGGVVLNVLPENIPVAFEALMKNVHAAVPEAKLDGALAVEMAAPHGKEIILGAKTEPGLGKLIMLGLGGMYVETFKDVTFRFSPLFQEDAKEMLSELKSLPLLTGTRGQQGIDTEKLISYIGRLSKLLSDFPEIEELDINPLLTFPNGEDFRVLDGRIRISLN